MEKFVALMLSPLLMLGGMTATVLAIAQTHNVSSAQVILHWHLQSNHVAIPGSANPDHIREDLDLFGFELTNEKMDALKALNEGSPYYGNTAQCGGSSDGALSASHQMRIS